MPLILQQLIHRFMAITIKFVIITARWHVSVSKQLPGLNIQIELVCGMIMMLYTTYTANSKCKGDQSEIKTLRIPDCTDRNNFW